MKLLLLFFIAITVFNAQLIGGWKEQDPKEFENDTKIQSIIDFAM